MFLIYDEPVALEHVQAELVLEEIGFVGGHPCAAAAACLGGKCPRTAGWACLEGEYPCATAAFVGECGARAKLQVLMNLGTLHIESAMPLTVQPHKNLVCGWQP